MSVSGGLARALVLGVVAVAAGCGATGERAQVSSATERFVDAVARREGRAACALLSPSAAQELERDRGVPCDQAVLALGLHAGAVRRVRVDAQSAQVVLSGGDAVFLGDSDRGWRLSAVGCRPAGGDAPLECAVSA